METPVRMLKQKQFMLELANNPAADVFVARTMIDCEGFNAHLSGWSMGFNDGDEILNLAASNGSLRTFKNLSSAEKLLWQNGIESFTVYTGY